MDTTMLKTTCYSPTFTKVSHIKLFGKSKTTMGPADWRWLAILVPPVATVLSSHKLGSPLEDCRTDQNLMPTAWHGLQLLGRSIPSRRSCIPATGSWRGRNLCVRRISPRPASSASRWRGTRCRRHGCCLIPRVWGCRWLAHLCSENQKSLTLSGLG